MWRKVFSTADISTGRKSYLLQVMAGSTMLEVLNRGHSDNDKYFLGSSPRSLFKSDRQHRLNVISMQESMVDSTILRPNHVDVANSSMWLIMSYSCNCKTQTAAPCRATGGTGVTPNMNMELTIWSWRQCSSKLPYCCSLASGHTKKGASASLRMLTLGTHGPRAKSLSWILV